MVTSKPILVSAVTPPKHCVHLIALAHGIDGSVDDLTNLRIEIGKGSAGVQTFMTTSCHGRTHDGIKCCADLYWAELRPFLENICKDCASSSPLRVSFVGHSLGGLILRAVAAKLLDCELQSCCTLDTMICIATPHLGCRLLGNGGQGGVAPLMSAFGPSIMRAGLRMIKGKTGPDLLLDNNTLLELASGKALRSFRRRVAYCNGQGDWLVNLESASLFTAEEAAVALRPSIDGCQKDGNVLWRPAAHEATPAVTPAWPSTFGVVDGVMRLQPLPDTWDPSPTVKLHTTWDDRSGRGRAAAETLRCIRSAGDWEAHVCHFLPDKASFAGGVFSPHIDLVDHPHCTQRYGREVVRHIGQCFADEPATNMNDKDHLERL